MLEIRATFCCRNHSPRHYEGNNTFWKFSSVGFEWSRRKQNVHVQHCNKFSMVGEISALVNRRDAKGISRDISSGIFHTFFNRQSLNLINICAIWNKNTGRLWACFPEFLELGPSFTPIRIMIDFKKKVWMHCLQNF